MSTTSIQAQLGYTAQASPIIPPSSVANERSQPSQSDATSQRSADTRQDPASLPSSQIATRSEKQRTTEQARTTRKTDVDWQTNSLVYRVIDSRSGQVVSQSPDEALLRLRAYAKQAATQADAPLIGAYHVMRQL